MMEATTPHYDTHLGTGLAITSLYSASTFFPYRCPLAPLDAPSVAPAVQGLRDKAVLTALRNAHTLHEQRLLGLVRSFDAVEAEEDERHRFRILQAQTPSQRTLSGRSNGP